MSEPQRTWRTRRISFTEDRGLLQRARRAFYGEADERYVDWMYGANPAGALYGHVATDGDVIAGQYVAIPIDMVAGNVAFKAALSLNTFTHEAYRRQGVFAALATAVFQDLAAAGCRFTIGFPNPDSHSGFVNHLGFAEPFGVHAMTRPLGRALLGPRLARFVQHPLRALARLSSLRIDAPATVPTAWIDRLWEQCRPTTEIGLAKTGTWFQWRFVDNPRASYRYLTCERPDGTPAGVLVWTREPAREGKRPAVTVVDLEAPSPRLRATLLGALLRELPDDVEVVHALATRGSALGRALLYAGFVPVKRFPFIYRAHRPDGDLRPVLMASAWSVSGAYADTF